MPDPYVKYPGLATQDRVEAAKRRTAQRSAPPQQPPMDMTQLESMLGGMNFGGPDMGAMQSYLQKAINGEFDPQISNTRKEIGRAKSRASGAKKDIGAMYDSLVGYYEGQKAPTKANYKASKADAAQRSKGLKENITNDYTNRLKEQVDMYKSLGIESAAPSATEAQNADQANSLAVADNTGGAEMAALNQQEAGDMSYWSDSGGAAKHEGTALQGDINLQLQDYLNKQNSTLSQLMGSKESAYNQGMVNLEQQAAQSQQQEQNQIWQRMMDLARLKQSAASKASQGPTKGMMGATSFLGNETDSNLFQQLMAEGSSWRNTAQARQVYGGHAPTSPEEWAKMIRDGATNRGLTPEQQQRMWQAALVYFGKMG